VRVSKDKPGPSWPVRAYVWVVDRLRWLVVLLWLGAVIATVVLLPQPATGTLLGDLAPRHTPAIAAQEQSLKTFGIPVTTGTVVVFHNPAGLSPRTEVRILLHALSVDQQLTRPRAAVDTTRVIGALPILKPADRTTAVTYLYFSPYSGAYTQLREARHYAKQARLGPGGHAYVTGLVPAELAQGHYIRSSLPLVEAATLALVVLIVAFVFRSLIAPFLILGAAGASFVVDQRVLGWIARNSGIGVPADVEPLVVALLLGVVTDYSIFFLSAFRKRLAAQEAPRVASRRAVAETAPIVLVAGLTVAAGCGALSIAPTRLFRSFGPGLAVTVAVGAITCVTMVPAVMTILGRFAFWPSRPARLEALADRALGRRRSHLAEFVSRRPGAAVAALACLAVMIIAALPVTRLRLSLSFARPLPASDPVRKGVEALNGVFPQGIVNPTEILLEGPRVTSQRAGIARLQKEITTQPGVATVLGPAQNPLHEARGVFLSQDGSTARVVVVLASDPLGATAVNDLRRIEDRGTAMVRRAGLHDVRLAFTGNTAIASDVARITLHNLVIILLAAFAAELVILALYLRALVAPLYLLLCSAATVASALGLTALVFQTVVGVSGLTFWVPFAAAVLLLALGADYNVFGIGSVWHQARHVPLPEAIRRVLPRTARAISTAGITLAASFALVALVPILTFAELAFALAVGLLIDTFLVRSILTPSLLTLIGPASGWPGHALRGRRDEPAEFDVPAELRPELARQRRR
jgi:RND superfamily putative drug exporter